MGEQQQHRLEELEKLIRQQQRVCIFIDNTCLFHALRERSNLRLDYKKLIAYLGQQRTTDVRFYYSEDWRTLDDDVRQKRRKFYSFLEHQLNYLMVELPLRKRASSSVTQKLVGYLRENGKSDDEILSITGKSLHWLQEINEPVSEEKGLDCEIVFDLVRLANEGRYSAFTLVTGDEDFARSVSRLRREGLTVDVAFFSQDCSTVLKEECSGFTDLTGLHELFRGSYTTQSDEAEEASCSV